MPPSRRLEAEGPGPSRPAAGLIECRRRCHGGGFERSGRGGARAPAPSPGPPARHTRSAPGAARAGKGRRSPPRSWGCRPGSTPPWGTPALRRAASPPRWAMNGATPRAAARCGSVLAIPGGCPGIVFSPLGPPHAPPAFPPSACPSGCTCPQTPSGWLAPQPLSSLCPLGRPPPVAARPRPGGNEDHSQWRTQNPASWSAAECGPAVPSTS
mmetsp:Transcript_92151/g.246328  ORF Transcript_92151/g.246328 Transcript_92151/m.246328 type:complete len:212 (-) Transcript_92151:257-892(-)